MEFEKVRNILSDLLKIDPSLITSDSLLVDDLGVDSLDLFQLLLRLEDEYDIEIDEGASDGILTAGDVADTILCCTGPQA